MSAGASAAGDVLPDFKGMSHEAVLAALHAWKQPRRYFEITVTESRTLRHAACPAVVLSTGRTGIGPQPPETLGRLAFVAQGEAKFFFRDFPLPRILPEPIDLAFLNGTHRCEGLLEEFTQVERLVRPDAIVVLHNCLPLEPAIAGRRPNPGAVRTAHRRDWWAGDLWRMALYLKRHRPDLLIRALDATPTGLVCITRLDPRRQVSAEEKAQAISTMMGYSLEEIGVAAFLQEMEVQSTAILAEPGGPERIFPASTPPRGGDAELLAEALKAAPPHGLATATLDDVVLQAVRGHPVFFRGGPVLDGDLNPLRHLRAWTPRDRFEAGLEPQERLEGTYIYGGFAYPHFGHFMAEMVHRIVPSLQTFGAGTFLFVAVEGSGTQFDHLPAWMRGVLRHVGLGAHNTRIVDRDCRVARLQICQQGACLEARADPSYLRLLATLSATRRAGSASVPTPSRIYVSRSRIAHGGNFLGERYLEGLLRASGYHVMYPEELEFEEQIALYTGAKDIIFCEGSACHGTELLGPGDLGRVLLVVKREAFTYTNVLEPRSQEFHRQSGHRFIGTLLRSDAGEPLLHFGLHLLDVGHFLDDLRDKGFCDIRHLFDPDAYRRAVHDDLYDHLAFHLRRRSHGLAKPSGLEDLLREFNRHDILGRG